MIKKQYTHGPDEALHGLVSFLRIAYPKPQLIHQGPYGQASDNWWTVDKWAAHCHEHWETDFEEEYDSIKENEAGAIKEIVEGESD